MPLASIAATMAPAGMGSAPLWYAAPTMIMLAYCSSPSRSRANAPASSSTNSRTCSRSTASADDPEGKATIGSTTMALVGIRDVETTATVRPGSVAARCRWSAATSRSHPR